MFTDIPNWTTVQPLGTNEREEQKTPITKSASCREMTQ